MDWAQLGEEIIKLGAPILGAALTGGTSEILPAVLGAVFNAAGISAEQIHSAMQSDVHAAAKVQQVEVDHAEHIASLKPATTGECS